MPNIAPAGKLFAAMLEDLACAKTPARRFASGLAIIALVLLLAGCSGPAHVSAAEFKREYTLVDQPQSMRRITYLGVREGRVALQVGSMSMSGGKWTDRIIYVLVGELDFAFLSSLPPEPIRPAVPARRNGT